MTTGQLQPAAYDSIPDGGAAVITDAFDGSATYIVPAGDLLVMQSVATATLPNPDEQRGYAAEASIREAAITGGLPDFYFRPEQLREGSSNIEVGDGIIVAHGIAAVIQSKARCDEVGTREKECRWLDKNVSKALAQARGTVRRLLKGPQQMTNGRGRRIAFDGAQYEWIGVVIIDHPSPPADHLVSLSEAKDLPCVVILRRDWEYLFDHLRSTQAVLRYLTRMSGEVIPLGNEPGRYIQTALSDLRADPDPLDDRLTELEQNARVLSHAISPLEPIGDSDRFFRQMLEDIATSELDESKEAMRLSLLMSLDTVPAVVRTELGQSVEDFFRSDGARRAQFTLTSTKCFVPSRENQPPIVFMTAVGDIQEATEILEMRSWLLSYDFYRALEVSEKQVVGVLFTPSLHPTRDLDTTTRWTDGGVGLTPELAGQIRDYMLSSLVQ